MRNVSLLDIFQDATRFSQQVTGYAWERAKEDEDLTARSLLLNLQQRGQIYLNGVAAGTIAANDDDDYLAGWETELAKWNAEGQSRVKTAYGRRLLQSMQEANLATMTPQLVDAKNRKQSADRNAVRAHNIELNNASGAPAKEKIDYAVWEESNAFTTGDVTRIDDFLKNLRINFTSIGADDLAQFIDVNFEEWFKGGKTFNEILGQIKRRVAELPEELTIPDPAGGWESGKAPEEINVRQRVDEDIERLADTDGEELRTVTGQINDWEDRLKKLDSKKDRAEIRNIQGLIAERKQLSKKINDETRAGLTAKYTGAAEAQRKAMAGRPRPTEGFTERQLKTTAWKKDLLDAAEKDLEARWNRAADGRKRTSESEMENLIENIRNGLLEGSIAHYYNGQELNVETANEMLAPVLEELLVQHGYDRRDVYGRFSESARIHSFMADVGKALHKMDPANFSETALIPFENAMVSIAKDHSLSPEMAKALSRQVNTQLTGLIMDVGLYAMTPEQWAERGRDMALAVVTEKIDLMKLTKDGKSQLKNLNGNPSDKDRVELYRQINAHPEAVNRIRHPESGKESYSFLGNANNYENLQGWAASDIKRRLETQFPSWGEIREGAITTGFDDEKRVDDSTAIPTVTIGEGKFAGTYKYDVEEGDDENLYLYKKTGDGWEKIGTGSADAYVATRLRENENDYHLTLLEGSGLLENTVNTIAQDMDAGLKPFAGKRIPEMRAELQKISHDLGVTEQDLYEKIIEVNINPFTGKPLKMISQSELDTILQYFADDRGLFTRDKIKSMLQKWISHE
jgi:hypothetical protein